MVEATSGSLIGRNGMIPVTVGDVAVVETNFM
jgi:hypothetical protein